MVNKDEKTKSYCIICSFNNILHKMWNLGFQNLNNIFKEGTFFSYNTFSELIWLSVFS